MKHFRLALSFLTIIPVREIEDYSDSMWAEGVLYYPICGYIIAFITVFPVFLLSCFLNTDPLLLSIITVALLALVTGALHLDGVSDLCDGFFCPVDSKKRRIEIMHDSRVGSFGVVGLVILLLIKFASLSVIFKAGNFLEVAAVIIIARFFIVLLAMISVYPEENGIGKFVIGKISGENLLWSFLVILPCLFCVKPLIVAIILLFVVLLLKHVSNKLIGGVTGDVLGACCEICETLGFLILAIS